MNNETIYEGTDVSDFLVELYHRRRYDNVEVGIQAVGLIAQDRSLFKINEEDGVEPHYYAEVNLSTVLEGDEYRDLGRETRVIMPVLKNLQESGVATVRITANPTEVLFFVQSRVDLTFEQLKCINIIAINALSIGFEKIKIGVSTPNLQISTKSDIMDVLDILDEEMEKCEENEPVPSGQGLK